MSKKSAGAAESPSFSPLSRFSNYLASKVSDLLGPATMALNAPPSATSPMSAIFSASERPPSNEPPKVQFHKGTTASQLLAAFSPTSQPKKIFQPNPEVPSYKIKMTKPVRDLRRKQPVSYEISDDEENPTSSNPESTFSTPQKPIVYLEEEIEIIDPESELDRTPPLRKSSAGHSLRQHSDLQLSLRAQENGDKRVTKKRKSTKSQRRPQRSVPAPPRTARNEVRDVIASETAAKRARFFIAKKEYFLPLLPESNHVQRLVDQQQNAEGEETGVPYEAFTSQPRGVKASMKPYQLSGLSFLVYMHRNGLSGILGDEMGLGKTLQTLSLIQYLKENRKLSGGELRPALVVCPLSVLSSWMAESRRWTPELKVLRFHGPIKERDRLKRVATGEEDMYGNMTTQSLNKLNNRRTAQGKDVIDLDADESYPVDERGVDLIVTTYEGFAAEQGWFKRAFVWSYVILDEGHKIKNDLSQISRALQGLGAEYRLILTGTPLQNNMHELWALLHWLYPEVFTERTSELFRSSFDLSKGKVDTKVMDDARRLLELIMLRRMKNSPGVDLNLPPKTDVLLYVPLTPMQRFWYERLLTRADQGLLEELFQGAQSKEANVLEEEKKLSSAWQNKGLEELESLDKDGKTADWEESKEILRQAIEAEQQDESKKSAWRKLMNLLMQLRKCCNHPYLLPHAEPNPYYIGDHIIHASGKFILLDKIVNELVINQKQKVLIFSGFTRMLDCTEDFLVLRGGDGSKFKYARLDGSTARARRNLGIRLFNQEDSSYRVMLVSTRAGGLGINLTAATTCIMLDQDWNPQIMLQAEARAHRIGQTKPVTVYKLCTQGTVEEQMMGRIQKKLYLSAKVTESMRDLHTTPKMKKGPGGRIVSAADDDMPQMDTGQLMSLVRRGAQALAHPEIDVNEMLNWDWETMLENCKDKPADTLVAKDTTGDKHEFDDNQIKEEDEKQWLSKMELVESRVFQGKTYTKARDLANYGDISEAWSREQRRVGKNTTVMIDGFAINKESLQCADWEAVPTMAGKDPRLAEPKREKKAEIVNQEHCAVCWDGGELVLCSGCPRSYHYMCLDKDFKGRSKAKIGFNCPQHQCFDCQQKTTDAGGMIYRCRWCERGFCEDCLDWDKTELLGENLKEYEILGFPAVTQAYYISCPSCTQHHVENPEARDFCQQRAIEIDANHSAFLKGQDLQNKTTELQLPSRAESLTDATTLESSGISTPRADQVDLHASTGKPKRKKAPETFKATSTKRSKRLTV